MEAVLTHLWNVSIQAIIIFCVVMAFRGLFSLCRVPKRYACGLWAILFIRLLLPVQLESAFGMMPQGGSIVTVLLERAAAGQEWTGGRVRGEAPEINAPETEELNLGIPQGSGGLGRVIPEENAIETGGTEGNGWDFAETGRSALTEILTMTWMGGMAVLLLYSLISCGCLKRRLRCSVRLDRLEEKKHTFSGRGLISAKADRIYLADGISTPFVMGLLSPRIYLPSAIEEKDLSHVIVHEMTHIRRGDPVVKMASFVISCVYWFHPVVWLGFLFLSRDLELSCDEAVMKELGAAGRGAYAESLLRLTCGARCFAGAPLAFSEGNTEGRIKHIMKYRKPMIFVTGLAAVLLVVLAAVLLTSPRAGADDGSRNMNGGDSAGMENGEDGSGKEEDPESRDAEEDRAPETDGRDSGDMPSVKRTELESAWPDVSGDTVLGVEGAILDYADESIVVFHDYFGLYVYSETQGRMIGSVDLRAIGCEATQGDHYCEVFTAQDGTAIYLHPLGREEDCGETDGEGTVRSGIRDSGYRYEVESGKLYQLEYSVYDREGASTSILFRETMEAEFSGISLAGGGDGRLESADWTVGNLVYVRDGKYTALFCGNAAGAGTLSFDNGTKVMIGGREYDLAERGSLINAVTEVSYVNGLWIVKGHINPNVGSYSFYNTENDSWEEDVFGVCLTWDSQAQIRQGTDIFDTLIYSRDNLIYNYEEDIVAAPELEDTEYIVGLARQGESVTVWITSADGQEGNRRELDIPLGQRRKHV